MITLNQGMPVKFPPEWQNESWAQATVKHHPQQTRRASCCVLSDIIIVRHPFDTVLSFGDLILAVGLVRRRLQREPRSPTSQAQGRNARWREWPPGRSLSAMLLGDRHHRPAVLLVFWIWALLDVISTDGSMCRNLPKPMWIILVVILPAIGAIFWLLLGRPEKATLAAGLDRLRRAATTGRPRGLPALQPPPIITDRRSKELDDELERWEREQREREPTSSDVGASRSTPKRRCSAARGRRVGRQERLDRELGERDVERGAERREHRDERELAVVGSQPHRDRDRP